MFHIGHDPVYTLRYYFLPLFLRGHSRIPDGSIRCPVRKAAKADKIRKTIGGNRLDPGDFLMVHQLREQIQHNRGSALAGMSVCHLSAEIKDSISIGVRESPPVNLNQLNIIFIQILLPDIADRIDISCMSGDEPMSLT